MQHLRSHRRVLHRIGWMEDSEPIRVCTDSDLAGCKTTMQTPPLHSSGATTSLQTASAASDSAVGAAVVGAAAPSPPVSPASLCAKAVGAGVTAVSPAALGAKAVGAGVMAVSPASLGAEAVGAGVMTGSSGSEELPPQPRSRCKLVATTQTATLLYITAIRRESLDPIWLRKH